MTKQFTRSDIDALAQRYRANLINSLSGFKSATLVGTSDGQTNNLAIVSSVVHVGANPPLIGMIMRPHTVTRDTLSNIKQQGFYTLNHVSADWVDKAHQTSARYAPEDSEFDAVGLTPVFSETFSAPYVKESEIKMGLKVAQHFTLLNETEMVIGEIQELFLPEEIIDTEGYADIEQAKTACISGLDSYHGTSRIAQFAYAKPGVDLSQK
ncbi:flavin oxidoreductase [Alteromonas mediterranea]|uniref:flavin reductase family protein n=1 Tax=Alteromonas mediterranea TaxID=314275 RepID=UPI001130D2D4|nr:flavin reductase [Alteromonas mediterranea]QDG36571.1 flavin oxidoreductase [Alteromonas mediterranea]QGX63587.1 flavin oxidoreductase [Alteromonas mediterranea]